MASEPGRGIADVIISKLITLRDGRTMELRSLRSADRPEHRAFVERLSRRSSRNRFFVPLRTLEVSQQDRFFDLDSQSRVALVAVLPGESVLRAVARYVRDSADTAECALVVDDAFQGLGIGRALLKRLAEVAVANGIDRFTAWVLADNHAMLGLLRALGWPMTKRYEGSVLRIEVELPIVAPGDG